MKPLPLFFRWLALAALADWLITRTFTRSAIFMPKSPSVIAAYQTLTFIGQWAFTVTGLLAFIAILWIAAQSWQTRRAVGLPLLLLSLTVFSLSSIFIALGSGWVAGYQLLLIAAVGMIGWQVGRSAADLRKKIAWLVAGLASSIGGIYQALPALYTAVRWPGPPPFTGPLFNLGELLVVLSPIALYWVVRPAAGWRHKSLAGIPALAFVVAHLANPAMTAIIAIWSTGLTLYLPWPLYAVSLWLGSMVVIAGVRQGNAVAWAALLLAAGGYAPQLSTQALVSLSALWLLGYALTSQPNPSVRSPADWLPASAVLSQASAGVGKS